jgi:hypothetical protein
MLQNNLSEYSRIELYFGTSFKNLRRLIAEIPRSVWIYKKRDELYKYIREQRAWDEPLVIKGTLTESAGGKNGKRGTTVNYQIVPIGESPDGFTLRDIKTNDDFDLRVEAEVKKRISESTDSEDDKDFFQYMMEGMEKIQEIAKGSLGNLQTQNGTDTKAMNDNGSAAKANTVELTIIRTASVMLGIPFDWLLLNCTVDWEKTDSKKLEGQVKQFAGLLGVTFKQ